MIDMRSDTVTRPTPGMREAMANAEVGDDVYAEDPTVNALEAEVAALFGHEAALFMPTGSMANQTAIQLLVPPANELLCDADAHVVTYEIGAAAAIGGVSTRTWPAAGGDIDPALIRDMIRPDGYSAVPTRAIAVEQTQNGAVIALDTPTEPSSAVDALFATDNAEAGELIGRYAKAKAAQLGVKPRIAMLDLASGDRPRDVMAQIIASAYHEPRILPPSDPEKLLAGMGYIDRRHLKASALAARPSVTIVASPSRNRSHAGAPSGAGGADRAALDTSGRRPPSRAKGPAA